MTGECMLDEAAMVVLGGGGQVHLVYAGGGPDDGGLYGFYTDCGIHLVGDRTWTELTEVSATCKSCINARRSARLARLRKACLAAAAWDTAYGEYNPKVSKLHGHCGCVARVVQMYMGGGLVGGKVNGESHIWNRLPDGTEWDLTSCQFGGDGRHPLIKGSGLSDRKTIDKRLALFISRFEKALWPPV